MDAIALSMFVEPAVVAGPSGVSSPTDGRPFGALVAAAATNNQHDVDDATDAPSDMAASQAGLMSAIVSQWLAQRDNSPSLPTFARGILEHRSSVVPEAAMSPDTDDEAALTVEALPPTNPGELSPEAVEHHPGNSKTHDTMPERDLADDASPGEGSIPVIPRAQVEDRRVPIQQLMQYAADMGLRVPRLGTNRTSADLTAAAPSEPTEDVIAEPQASKPLPRPNVAFSQQATDAPADDQAKHAATFEEVPVRGHRTEADPIEPKATPAADRPSVPKQSGEAHASTRPLESLPQPSPNAPTNTPTPPSPAPDNINITSASNISVAADHSVDMPVKLAAATREGQTAEMQTLALHIAARWAKGESRFTIRLDPPELGRIDVNLNVNSHGHAQAVLAVEKPQTLDLLLRDAPTLERALKDAGLELGGNLSFSLKEEGRQTFAQGDRYSPPPRTVEFMPTDAARPHAPLNASLIEQLYGSRMARLDITV